MKSKSVFLLVVLVIALSGISFAAFDEQQQGQIQGQGQDQGQLQGQGQQQGQAAISAQSQGQGQIGSVSTTNSIEGDENESYANSWPTTQGGNGSNNMNAYSIFGGVGITQTAEYQVCIEKLQVIQQLGAAGVLSEETVISESLTAWEQLKKATRPERWMGYGFRSSGRNILNLMGLLSWPSLRPSENK